MIAGIIAGFAFLFYTNSSPNRKDKLESPTLEKNLSFA
jgi:hypothetical protein